jgi:hypothetical protein
MARTKCSASSVAAASPFAREWNGRAMCAWCSVSEVRITSRRPSSPEQGDDFKADWLRAVERISAVPAYQLPVLRHYGRSCH